MKHRFILFVSTLVLSIVFGCSALAYDVKVDGIYYNLDDTNKTAEVTNEDYDSYSGVVVIPASFKVNEIDYSVTSIGKSAFSWMRRPHINHNPEFSDKYRRMGFLLLQRLDISHNPEFCYKYWRIYFLRMQWPHLSHDS